ncbi:MAG: hypothetical protein ACK455_07385 [Bacteroidota bacterium]
MNKLILTVIAYVVIFSSCKHEPVNPNSNPSNSGVCNTDTAYFQNDVLPLFVSSCAKSGCHDAITQEKGYNLTNYNSIMSSGEIKAGKPNSGDIMEEINSGSMPPSSPLSADQKALLSKWISQGAKNNGCTSACDTTNVKYSVQVKTIIDANCKGCHSGSSPQGSIDLSTYELVKAQVTLNKLYESISHTGEVSPMPKSNPQTKLSDCQIRAVKIWIDAGAPNN